MEQKFLLYLEEDIEINYKENGVEWVNYMLDNADKLEERVADLLANFNEENDTELTFSDIENNAEIFDVNTYYLDRLTIYSD